MSNDNQLEKKLHKQKQPKTEEPSTEWNSKIDSFWALADTRNHSTFELQISVESN